MINEQPHRTWIVVIVAIIGAAGVIIAAIISLGMPFAERIADRYYPTFTPIANINVPVESATQAVQQQNSVPPSVSTSTIPVIPPTSMPVSIGTISVPGNSSEGIRFNVTQTGIYVFKYVSGSYSTYSANQKPPAGVLTWLTAVRVFKNRPIAWNGEAISEQNDYRIVDFAYFPSAGEAEAAAKGHSLTASLLNGDYLILVTVDGLQYYSDNPGEVTLEVLYTPNQ